MDKATIPASSRAYRSSRLMHALICGFSLAFMASSNGQELIESSKQGAITAWKLQDFYAGYRDDNQHSYLKVKIKNQTVLWDANRMVFTPWLDSFSKRLSKSDTFLNNTNPLVLDSHTTIQIGGDVTRYALSFSQFIKVTNNDVSEAEFYIINRAGDDYVEQRFCCDSLEPVQTLRQELSSPQFVNVEKLENGDQIFLVVSAKLVYAVRVSPRSKEWRFN